MIKRIVFCALFLLLVAATLVGCTDQVQSAGS